MLEQITISNYHSIPESLRKNNQWEIPQETHSEDPAFDNELWAMDILLNWGSYATALKIGECIEYLAVYAPPRYLPLAQQFTAGPVSHDAILLSRLMKRQTKLFSAEQHNHKMSLLNGVIQHLQHRGIKAIESFGCKNTQHNEYQLIDATALEEYDFVILRDDEFYPLYRLELNETIEWKIGVEQALKDLLITDSLHQSATALV